MRRHRPIHHAGGHRSLPSWSQDAWCPPCRSAARTLRNFPAWPLPPILHTLTEPVDLIGGKPLLELGFSPRAQQGQLRFELAQACRQIAQPLFGRFGFARNSMQLHPSLLDLAHKIRCAIARFFNSLAGFGPPFRLVFAGRGRHTRFQILLLEVGLVFAGRGSRLRLRILLFQWTIGSHSRPVHLGPIHIALFFRSRFGPICRPIASSGRRALNNLDLAPDFRPPFRPGFDAHLGAPFGSSLSSGLGPFFRTGLGPGFRTRIGSAFGLDAALGAGGWRTHWAHHGGRADPVLELGQLLSFLGRQVVSSHPLLLELDHGLHVSKPLELLLIGIGQRGARSLLLDGLDPQLQPPHHRVEARLALFGIEVFEHGRTGRRLRPGRLALCGLERQSQAKKNCEDRRRFHRNKRRQPGCDSYKNMKGAPGVPEAPRKKAESGSQADSRRRRKSSSCCFSAGGRWWLSFA